jgi:hypothetical protein
MTPVSGRLSGLIGASVFVTVLRRKADVRVAARRFSHARHVESFETGVLLSFVT